MNSFEYVEEHLQKIEDSQIDDRLTVYKELRKLGIYDFLGALWHMPAKEYPRFPALVPEMASLEVQSSWTGSKNNEEPQTEQNPRRTFSDE